MIAVYSPSKRPNDVTRQSKRRVNPTKGDHEYPTSSYLREGRYVSVQLRCCHMYLSRHGVPVLSQGKDDTWYGFGVVNFLRSGRRGVPFHHTTQTVELDCIGTFELRRVRTQKRSYEPTHITKVRGNPYPS